MALYKFTKAILPEEHVAVFDHRLHTRDFTCVEDIAEAMARACDRPSPCSRVTCQTPRLTRRTLRRFVASDRPRPSTLVSIDSGVSIASTSRSEIRPVESPGFAPFTQQLS